MEKKSKKIIDINNKEVQQVIRDLVDTCIEMESRSAGLAAPQIGKNLAICVCRRTDLEENLNTQESLEKGELIKLPNEKLWEVFINPEIVEESKRVSTYWEACLSIGEKEKDSIFGPVDRPETVKIKYINREGESKKITASGFFSHIIQHEIDNLDGVLFCAHVENPQENL